MIKSMFKRTVLSIIRKPSRTIILGIILFVMANLVLASISIKSSVNESTNYAKKTLGSTVYLSVDIEKLRSEMEAGSGRQGIRMSRPSVPVNDVKEIGNLSYVKDFTYSVTTFADSSGFDAVSYENDNIIPGGGGGGSAAIAVRIGNIQIQGINSYAFINEVKNNTMTLVEGTYFDETTDDKAIISYSLASSNDISVGDKITLENVETKELVELEVIGIYDVSEENYSENTIYMNTDSASKFLSSDLFADGNYGVNNVSFELFDPESSDKFIKEALAISDVEANNMILDIDSSAYEKMAGPIESVGEFASSILWIVVIASIAIISLMIHSNVKDRKYEIGVLMSLGASKKNVAGQILLELIIIGTASFVLSFATSSILAKGMSKNLLDDQIAMSEEAGENNFGRPNGMGGQRINGLVTSMMGGPNSEVEAIDEINVSISPENYLLLFLIGYGVMALSMVIPTINIIKYEPKTILTGRE